MIAPVIHGCVVVMLVCILQIPRGPGAIQMLPGHSESSGLEPRAYLNCHGYMEIKAVNQIQFQIK